jgi:hypothetical protein
MTNRYRVQFRRFDDRTVDIEARNTEDAILAAQATLDR